MIRIKIIAIISACAAMIAAGTLLAMTLPVASDLIVVMAGQTVEIPLSSSIPIASDLTASGDFQRGDVRFTAGPGCHLSANGCTLWVTVAATSKDYARVPVLVSAAAATNTAVFELSVTHSRGDLLNNAKLPKLVLIPTASNHSGNVITAVPATAPAVNHPPAPLQRSGNALFNGLAEAHPGLGSTLKDANADFTPNTNGPVYQIVTLTNYDVAQPLVVTISGDGASSFSLDDQLSDYGAKQNCAALTSIAAGDSCLVIVKGKVGDPSQAPQTAILTIRGDDDNIATFTLTNTTYIYAAGGFNALGNASVSGGDLLAECTAGTCSNALQGMSGNNYATTNFGVGQWINALSVTPAGNLMVGGVFGAIGGATSGSSSTTASLLAQCTPGSVLGNACINQMNGGSNNYAFNHAYIDAITAPFLIGSNNFMAVGGDFTQIRGFATTGQMLAKCLYSGTSATPTCNTYLTTTTKYANNAIVALDYFNSKVNSGGLFTQIAGYPTSAPSSGTTFASCTTSSCTQSMGSNNPNNSILGVTDDGANLYIGGAFTRIGGYTDSSGGYPLVACTPAATTTCSNALSGSNDADGYIEGIAYSGGSLYVGGKFNAIGGATVSGGNMLAVCTVGSACSNFVTDTNPYATGDDWGGEISAVAVGSQTSISAN